MKTNSRLFTLPKLFIFMHLWISPIMQLALVLSKFEKKIVRSNEIFFSWCLQQAKIDYTSVWTKQNCRLPSMMYPIFNSRANCGHGITSASICFSPFSNQLIVVWYSFIQKYSDWYIFFLDYCYSFFCATLCWNMKYYRIRIKSTIGQYDRNWFRSNDVISY